MTPLSAILVGAGLCMTAAVPFDPLAERTAELSRVRLLVIDVVQHIEFLQDEAELDACTSPDEAWVAAEAIVGYRLRFAAWPWDDDPNWAAAVSPTLILSSEMATEHMGIIAELTGDAQTALEVYSGIQRNCWNDSWQDLRMASVLIQLDEHEKALGQLELADQCEPMTCDIRFQGPGCAPLFSSVLMASKAIALEALRRPGEAYTVLEQTSFEEPTRSNWIARLSLAASLPAAKAAAQARLMPTDQLVNPPPPQPESKNGHQAGSRR